MPKTSLFIYICKELRAIISAIKKWRHCLLGNKFISGTDEKSLKELKNQVVQTPGQHYHPTKLLGYDYEIIYRSDKEQTVTDAFSRVKA